VSSAPLAVSRRSLGRRASRARHATVEHSILITATLCLLALGAIMVYSASAPSLLESSGGSGTAELVSFVVWAVAGLGAMELVARRGVLVLRRVTGPLLALAFVLLLAVKLPGLGHAAYGAQRWIGAGPLKFEPSELMKLALVLYCAQVLAGRATQPERLRVALKRLVVVGGSAGLLVVTQPDLGTTLVIAFTLAAMIFAAGVPLRLLGVGVVALVGVVLVFTAIKPYALARLTSFLNPWAHATGSGYQAVWGQIAIGSGGLLGRGPGGGVTKDLYLPNGPTDFILAVIGEELGVLGVCGVLSLYGLLTYAGLRTARATHDHYSMLLAAGVTSLIAVQAILNVFAVLSLAPLTGVPLPFVSYGSSSLVVMLAAMGILLAISRQSAAGLRVVERTRERNPRRSGYGREATDRDRGRRDSGARHAGAGDRRRARGAGR
jgi:cell division protein FtsW